MVRGDITVADAPTTQVPLKYCAPFIQCITKWWNNNNAESFDLVMPMYNLTEYSSNYSEPTGSLWFYSEDEASNVNNNIANTDNFKSIKFKAKLLGNTDAQPATHAANRILKNAAIAVPLKYLSNFWRSLEGSLIHCRWTKHFLLSTADTDNANGKNDDKNIIFTIKGTKLYVPVVALSARDNQKLSKFLSKRSERSVYWNEHKTSENKNTTNEHWHILKSNFVGLNRLFVLDYTNEDNPKRFNARKYYFPKGKIKNYNVIINEKTFITMQLILT